MAETKPLASSTTRAESEAAAQVTADQAMCAADHTDGFLRVRIVYTPAVTYVTDPAPPLARRAMPYPATWLVRLGAGFVLLGGLVAAVTGPLALSHGSWLAAYLVLVCGVAQYAMGRATGWFGHRGADWQGWARLAGWNTGNLAVIAGTLATAPLLVDAGGLVLLLVLVGALRDALPGPLAAPRRYRHGRVAYLTMLTVLAASIPVGLILAHLRAGVAALI